MNKPMNQILIFTAGTAIVFGIMGLGSPLAALYCFAMAGVIFYIVGRSK